MFFIDSLAQSGAWSLIFVRIPSHASTVSLLSCIIIWFTPLACSTARNSQLAHSRATVMHGRDPLNSENSVGDTEDGELRFCVPGETKSLSTSTWRGVRRSAVDESAHLQQTPLKFHDETWSGILRNQHPRFFREVEIVPGCAVAVACPSCPDHSPEPPEPRRIIRNMLGWSQMEKTVRSGVWLFRGRSRNDLSSVMVAERAQ